jgi:hypothetical protein
VITPCTWTIFVEIFMQVSQRTMIGAVLSATVEALLMSILVGLGEIPVNSPVVLVIVLIVVRESRRHRCGQQQRCYHRKSFSDGHGMSPLRRARRYGSYGTDFWPLTSDRMSLNAAGRIGLAAVHHRAVIRPHHLTRSSGPRPS